MFELTMQDLYCLELIWQFTAENENSKNAKSSLVELFFVEVN